jgi:hypothetical protein
MSMSNGAKTVPAIVSLLTYFVMLVSAMALLAGSKVFTSSEGLGMGIQLALFFPCGLGLLFGPGSRGAGLVFILVSYASFLAFLVAFVKARSWGTYGMLCVGFAVLLLLNVAGCHAMHKDLSGITMNPNLTREPTAAALCVRGGAGTFAAPWLARLPVSGGCGSALR